MRVALVHDWLLNLGGAERTLIALHEMFPEAPVYTIFYDSNFKDRFLPRAKVIASRLNKLPLISWYYRLLLLFFPSAIESLDLSDFDLVISSSVIFPKGLVLKPKTRHICYCYSPTRFLWDRNTNYERRGLFSSLARHYLRIWDKLAAERPTEFVAISENVRKRIKKYYERDAQIIYPPVSTRGMLSNFIPSEADYYLLVSRLYDFKNVALAVDVFNKLGSKLIIIGDGPARQRLMSRAEKNIIFKGFVPDEFLGGYYKYAKAFIMPQEEDFGLTPVEAMSYGKPVLALRKGGALEIIREGIDGEFFDDPIPEALADGMRRLNDNYEKYKPEAIKKNAEKFSPENFRNAILGLVK